MNQDPNQNPFGRNPLYPWLRVMLWIIPTGFTVLTAAFVASFGRSVTFSNSSTIEICALLDVAFVIGAGWCDFQLSSPKRKANQTVGIAILLFFLGQIFIIPILLGALVFSACLISSFHI